MAQSDHDLDRLNVLLHALPIENMPMTLSELDGYLTGVLACPDVIPVSEWLQWVWGETGDAEFPDQKRAEETIGAVMAHYNALAQVMTQSLWLEPIYGADPISHETLWEPWINGFTRAMSLRPEAWSNLLDAADEETQATLIFLLALQDVSAGESRFSDEEIEQIDLEAPDLIPNCVATILHQSRPELAARIPSNLSGKPLKAGSKPGQNDPCACGSGRKYKQCCASN